MRWHRDNSASNPRSGFGLLEAVIGVTIISIALFSLASVLQLALKASFENTKRIQAGFLLEEGVEAIKSMRDSGWASKIAVLGAGAPFYLVFDGTQWTAVSSQTYVNNTFERKFYVYDVYRDANDDIAASGTLDSGTKKIVISVAWMGRAGTTTEQSTMYLANIFNN